MWSVWGVFCVVLLVVVEPFVEGLKVQFPNPGKDFAACSRPGPSRLCDPQGYLSPGGANRIDGQLQRFEEILAPCGRAYQVAVAITSNIHRETVFSGTIDDARQMAKQLHDEWGVGYKDCENGIVLFLSINDRVLYISTGAHSMSVLTDSLATEVINRMKPFLKERKYDDAIENALKNIEEILRTGKITPISNVFSVIFTVSIVGFVAFMFCFTWFKSREQEKTWKECKTKLSKIDEQRALELSKKYQTTHCPICLENFEEGDDPSSDSSKSKLLGCGHRFCKTCLDEWLNKNSTCPVCRYNTNQTTQASQQVDSIYPFELYMLQQRYPTYITHTMINRWSSPAYQGSFINDPLFVSSNPATSRSSSSSSRFGGGSSSGGGGSGGSW